MTIPRIVNKSFNEDKDFDFCGENSVYLVTGGTGGIGSVLIDYLKEKNVKRIVSLSRNEFKRVFT